MANNESYRLGDLTLDVTGRLLIRDGELVTLPPKTRRRPVTSRVRSPSR